MTCMSTSIYGKFAETFIKILANIPYTIEIYITLPRNSLQLATFQDY